MEKQIVLVKEKESKATSPIFIDIDLLERLREVKQETKIPIQKLAEKFIKYGLENYVVVEE